MIKKIFSALIVVAMLVIVYSALSWVYDGLDLPRPAARCDSGSVESLFSDCKVIRP
jgi:hypothetical protein